MMPKLDKDKLGKAWGTLRATHYYYMQNAGDWHRYASARSLLRAIDDYLAVVEEYLNQGDSVCNYDSKEKRQVPQSEIAENLQVKSRTLGRIVAGKFETLKDA